MQVRVSPKVHENDMQKTCPTSREELGSSPEPPLLSPSPFPDPHITRTKRVPRKPRRQPPSIPPFLWGIPILPHRHQWLR